MKTLWAWKRFWIRGLILYFLGLTFIWFNPSWYVGLVVSLCIGDLATMIFVESLNSKLGFTKEWRRQNIDFDQNVIPSWLIGTLERLFFTILVAYEVSAVSAGIMTWVLIKMASNWNRINPTRGRDYWNATDDSVTTQDQAQHQQIAKQEAKLRIYAMKSLLGVLVSMLFAVLGGLIWSGEFWIYFIPQTGYE